MTFRLKANIQISAPGEMTIAFSPSGSTEIPADPVGRVGNTYPEVSTPAAHRISMSLVANGSAPT
jgi:hypothetical protein